MITGKIVRFDRMRGYGFIAPDTGGEDVFVHANELEADGAAAAVGSRVGFDIVEGERGLKAYDVRLLGDEARPVPAPSTRSANGSADGSADGARTLVADREAVGDDDEMDVLNEREFVGEVTELLLNASPTLTATHVVEVRKALVGLARAHGWID
ncbi:MAG TPA: cold shock domain-containing protein [Micromonosporaceae bacterium]|nr:cold shock domain-containing protein [Micromonosporaceae bacterium]